MKHLIPTKIIPSVEPAELSPSRVEREFRNLIAAGAKLRPAGEARRRPMRLLSEGYTPKYKIELFDTVFYLPNVRQNPDLRFFVAYIAQRRRGAKLPDIYPRIIYKDLSLVWRTASHLILSGDELWIGKGAVRAVREGGEELIHSVESTTDLPLELQSALEAVNRRVRKIRFDEIGLRLVLRRAPRDRIEPYSDFTAPRERAASDRRNLINGGKRIARFTRKNDPSSLVFVAGFEPDFSRGIVEQSASSSTMYGGALQRFRILSKNRAVQYMFIAGPNHVWIIPPQATTTELSTYGVRTVDAVADEDAFVPGYEYHFLDDTEDPPVFHSQIPEGYAGKPSVHDDSRADASAWLDRLPVIRQFRRRVLGSTT